MGKKKTKKTNNQSKSNNNNNNENTINNGIEKNEEDDEEIIEIKIELKNLLDIINSNNSYEIYKLTTFLSNYNYDLLFQEEEKRDKEIFALTSNNFLLAYLSLYLKNNLNEYTTKIKHNIISSIINIFSVFG